VVCSEMSQPVDAAANSPSDNVNVDDVVIRYTIRDTTFGPILIAFKGGKVCMVHQSGTEVELLVALEDKFPSILWQHTRIDDSQTSTTADPFSEYADMIMGLLDREM
jgi:hypothetical protein